MAEITASAATLNLVAASPLPFRDAVLVAVITEADITNALLKTVTTGVATSIPRIYNYAKNEYTLGLPQGTALDHGSINLSLIESILLSELGDPPVSVTGARYVDITPAIAVYPHLLNTRKYSPVTNEITVYPEGIIWQPSGSPQDVNVATAAKKVTLQQAVVAADGISIDITYAQHIERPVVVLGPETEHEYIIVLQFVQTDYTFTENVPLPEIVNITWGEKYLVAFYRHYDESGAIPIGEDIPWLYQLSSHVYPELDPSAISITGLDYFPVIPLRYRNSDLTAIAYEETPLYITSKKLAKLANIDITAIAGKLNENPNIAEMDHAYLMYGINLQTIVPESLKYLHKFFKNLYDLQSSNELDYLINIGTPYYGTAPINTYQTSTMNSNGVFTEYGLDLFIDYDYVKSLYDTGIIGNGKIGNIEKTTFTYGVTVSNGFDENGVEIFTGEVRGGLTLALQIAVNYVHKIEIYGLSLRNTIYGYRGVQTVTMLDVIQNTNENNLVIPLQYQLAQSFPLKDRNPIYADAMLLVINSYKVTDLKWYQTGWFKFVMIIIIAVVIYYTGQYYLAEYALAVGTATALMTSVAVAVGYFVAMQLLIALAISMVANYIIKEYGTKVGIIGAIILTIMALILTRGQGGTVMMEFLLATPQYLLQAATALISSANEFLVTAGQDIVNEYADFSAEIVDRYKELQTAEDLLKMKADVDPLLFARTARLKIIPNETPDAFYSRCLELPNYTMHVIHDEIPNFFSARLKLPRALPTEMYV